MKIADISYHSSYLDLTPEEYLQKANPNLGYADFLDGSNELIFFFHSKTATTIAKKNSTYIFRKKIKNNPLLFPILLSLKLRRMRPDVVLVHSIIYIHFAAFLRFFLSRRTKIFVQNHAEKTPQSSIKKWVVAMCDPMIDGYFFVSKELAQPWVKQGLIKTMKKVHEIMEGSSSFTPKSRRICREALQIPDVQTFIWVGRLDGNKDPMCVLRAFRNYATQHTNFKLYMFYHTEELLEQLKSYIRKYGLENHVLLQGKIPHAALETWYNASDFFVAASHSEGSGYALCEAMSCGCIPIVSKIPSFKYMTNQGDVGFLFESGNHSELYQSLMKIDMNTISVHRNRVLELFQKRLSFQAIARKMEAVYLEKKSE